MILAACTFVFLAGASVKMRCVWNGTLCGPELAAPLEFVLGSFAGVATIFALAHSPALVLLLAVSAPTAAFVLSAMALLVPPEEFEALLVLLGVAAAMFLVPLGVLAASTILLLVLFVVVALMAR